MPRPISYAVFCLKKKILYIHVTLLPHIGATGEVKTKPTQHSVMELRRVGITADVIVCRADHPISDEIFYMVAPAANVNYTLSLHDALPICKSKHSAMLRNKETRHRMFIGLLN